MIKRTLILSLAISLNLIGSELWTKAATPTWYDSAQIRIDSIRKGHFTFKVVDKDGNAVKDSVKIKHVKHEFPFGIAYDFQQNGNYGNTYTYSGRFKFQGSKDTVVYNTERYAKSLIYNLPVKVGNTYKLDLKFAEIYDTIPGIRLFDVYINNEKKLSNFDIYAIAGATYKALDSCFTISSKDTIIKIQLIALKDNAKINGIALYDSNNKPLILLNCGGPATITQEGKFITDSAYIDKTAANYVPTTDDWATSVIQKYFNWGVTGNPFKWSGIESDSGKLKYDLVDAAVNWGAKTGFDYRGHNLIWGSTSATDYHELPHWVHNLLPPLLPTPQRAWAACKNRVIRDAGKYKIFFKEYDVLNEPLNAKILQTAIGDSIDWYAFKWAHEAAPNVKLFVNEYNVEWTGGKVNDYKALIKRMIANGAHIDGIGVQAHLYTHPNPKYGNFNQNGDSHYDINVPDLKRNMDTLATLGLPIKFTEFDLDTTTQVKQAFNYARMMRFAFSYPACNGLICWSFYEPAWQPSIGGIFDAQKHPKIVADTIYNLLHNVWTTKITDMTDANGAYKFRGYYGNYEISVKVGNVWKIFALPYIKDNQDSIFVLKEDKGKATRPIFQVAKIINRNQIEVKFNKPMADPGLIVHSYMIFGDLSTGIDSAKIKTGDSTTIVLNLKSPVKSGYFMSLGYANGAQTSSDGGELENFGPEILQNPYPSVISAVTSKDGKTVILKFNKSMNDPSGQDTSFTIKAGNLAHYIKSIALQAGNDSIMVIPLKDSIRYGEKPFITYKAGKLASTDDFDLDAFTDYSIVNNVLKTDAIATTGLSDIKIYPNPATNVVNISGAVKFDMVLITDMIGQTVKALKTNSIIETVDVSDLPNATYIISVKSGNIIISRSILLKIK